MKPTERKDAVALLAILAGALTLAGIHQAGRLAHDPLGLHHAGSYLAAVALGSAAVGVVLGALRIVATRRTLRSRIRLAVVPSDSFDPSLEAIARFAAQLTRTPGRRWLA